VAALPRGEIRWAERVGRRIGRLDPEDLARAIDGLLEIVE
jgi:hypothetical protein